MVRNYKRKGQRGSTYSKENLERAVNEIKASVLGYNRGLNRVFCFHLINKFVTFKQKQIKIFCKKQKKC